MSAFGNMNVETDVLNNTGESIDNNVGAQVRSTYTNLVNTINAVTAKEAWKSAASEEFLAKFEDIKPTFELHLSQLEELGPTLQTIATGYSDAEDENLAAIKV